MGKCALLSLIVAFSGRNKSFFSTSLILCSFSVAITSCIFFPAIFSLAFFSISATNPYLVFVNSQRIQACQTTASLLDSLLLPTDLQILSRTYALLPLLWQTSAFSILLPLSQNFSFHVSAHFWARTALPHYCSFDFNLASTLPSQIAPILFPHHYIRSALPSSPAV